MNNLIEFFYDYEQNSYTLLISYLHGLSTWKETIQDNEKEFSLSELKLDIL